MHHFVTGLHGVLIITHEDVNHEWKGHLYALAQWSAYSNDLTINFLPSLLIRVRIEYDMCTLHYLFRFLKIPVDVPSLGGTGRLLSDHGIPSLPFTLSDNALGMVWHCLI